MIKFAMITGATNVICSNNMPMFELLNQYRAILRVVNSYAVTLVEQLTSLLFT